MDYEELKQTIQQEEQQAMVNLVNALFSGTEHSAGGESVAHDRIMKLMEQGYIRPSVLLRKIGFMLENQFIINGNKNYSEI